MEIVFTPWRMHYINSHKAPRPGCVLCNIHADGPDHDAEHFIVHRGTTCYVVLNIFPYNTAHLMVVPFQHTGDLCALDPATSLELFDLTRQSVAIVNREYQPHGCNVGMNLGQAAGPVSPIICICISCRAGAAMPISCRSSAAPSSSLKRSKRRSPA